MATAKKKPEPKPNDNLELWNKVCVTDPAYTKRADTRGGFTSINATWQAWVATGLWGPYGKLWGVKDLKYDFVGIEKVGVTLIAKFFCPVSEFEIATDMPYKPNDDCFKKLLTDLTTKSLSKLGFSADVFFGLYDDARYTQAAAQTYADHRAGQNGDVPPPAEPSPQPDAPEVGAVTDPIQAACERLAVEDKDLVKAWSLEPLKTRKVALTAIRDLVDVVLNEAMVEGHDDVDLYKATRQRMNTVIDARLAG
jgi:hypothetical protein